MDTRVVCQWNGASTYSQKEATNTNPNILTEEATVTGSKCTQQLRTRPELRAARGLSTYTQQKGTERKENTNTHTHTHTPHTHYRATPREIITTDPTSAYPTDKRGS